MCNQAKKANEFLLFSYFKILPKEIYDKNNNDELNKYKNYQKADIRKSNKGFETPKLFKSVTPLH